MERPTQEQVDNALRLADLNGDDLQPFKLVELYNMPGVLAAEVRALRRDLQLFRDSSEAAELRIVELRAELAAFDTMVRRLERLRDEWIAPNEAGTAADADVQRYLCGDALRDALNLRR